MTSHPLLLLFLFLHIISYWYTALRFRRILTDLSRPYSVCPLSNSTALDGLSKTRLLENLFPFTP